MNEFLRKMLFLRRSSDGASTSLDAAVAAAMLSAGGGDPEDVRRGRGGERRGAG